MFVRQISVFLENVHGALYELTQLLGENDINLLALSIADTANFGIVRCITREDQIERATELLRARGHVAQVHNVLCVCVPHEPLGLAKVLRIIEEAGISVEYLYSFYENTGSDAVLIIRPSEKTRCYNVLKENGIELLEQEQIDQLV